MQFTDYVNRVRIGGRIVPRQMLASADGQQILRAAYLAAERPLCLCQGEQSQLPLYIARWGDGLLLKRMPNTGGTHHADCQSYGGISDTARTLYTEQAIQECDGRVRIGLAAPLALVVGAAPVREYEQAISANDAGQGRKRAHITLRGLVNHLWEEAGLNRWYPAMAGRRTLSVVYHYLRQTCADRELGARLPLAEALYIPEVRRSVGRAPIEAEIALRYAALQRRHGVRWQPILLLLGEAQRLDRCGPDQALLLRLKGMADLPLWSSNDALVRLQASWPTAFSRLNQTRLTGAPAANRVFVLAGVTRSPRAHLRVQYAAAMETTHEFIPVESAAEATMARALVSQHRAFEKPLRYDAAAELFPDFRLLDTEPPTVLEVWGMQTPAYLERKREKRDAYRRNRVPLIEWNAAADEPLPTLPPGARSCMTRRTAPLQTLKPESASRSRFGTTPATTSSVRSAP